MNRAIESIPDTSCAAARDLARDSIERLAHEMRRNAQILIHKQDPDAIHDLRVASRRIRAAFTEFRAQFGPEAWNRCRVSVRRVTKRLGPPRELDVTLQLIRQNDALSDASPNAREFILQRLERERADCDADVRDVAHDVHSETFDESIDVLLAAYRPTPACTLLQAERHLDERMRKARKTYKTWQKSRRDEDLHQLRIAFKKFRYTIELYQPLYGKALKNVRKKLKDAQESLGEWNDDRIVVLHIQRIAAEPLEFHRNELEKSAKIFDARAQHAHAHVAGEVSEFFTKNARRDRRAIFAEPTAPCCQNR